MRKQIVGGATISFGFLLTAAGGCGKIDDAAPVDAGADVVSLRDGDGPGPYDGSCCGPSLWEVACFDPTVVVEQSTPPLPPTANQGKCASDDLITQFYAACVATTPDAGLDASVDAGETCETYLHANPDCALCVGGYSAADAGPPAPSPWPALLQIDASGKSIPNVAACLAAISTGTDTCKSNYARDDFCLESGCAACSAADFSACATAQSTDPASTCLTSNPLDSACQAALNAVSQTDADTKCAASTSINTDADFQAVFMTVAKTLCE